MKSIAIAALLGSSKGQITPCATTDDCIGKDDGLFDNGGCCNQWTMESFDGNADGLGVWKNNWKYPDENVAVGNYFSACMPKAYVEEIPNHLNVDGQISNYKDLPFLRQNLPAL